MRSIKVLAERFDNRPLSAITAGDVERFKIKQRRRRAKDGRKVTPAAVNRELAVLRILFNLALRLGEAEINPAAGVKLLPENNQRMRVISPEEEASYLAAASQPLRDVAMLMLETGMRPGEIFHLRKRDVRLELGFVQVSGGRTPSARTTISLTTLACEVLTKRLAAACSDWLFPVPWDHSHPPGSVRKAHAAAVRKAQITPHFRLYDLRHAALTRMAMAGIDLPTLRELGGHANIQMTMRYVHPTPQHKRAAIKKLEGFCLATAIH